MAVEDFFSPDAQLCYPKHRRTLMADCGMKVNVRIKTDILSDFVVFIFLFFGLLHLVTCFFVDF